MFQAETEAGHEIAPDVERVAAAVVRSAFEVYHHLGPGLKESHYEQALERELRSRGIHVDRQQRATVTYKGEPLDGHLQFDIVAGGCVVVEAKAIDTVLPLHNAQLNTYLRVSGHTVGLLINFNVVRFRDAIRRQVWTRGRITLLAQSERRP